MHVTIRYEPGQPAIKEELNKQIIKQKGHLERNARTCQRDTRSIQYETDGQVSEVGRTSDSGLEVH
jgi:hypothetical protein